MNKIKPTTENVMRLLAVAVDPGVEYNPEYFDFDPEKEETDANKDYGELLGKIEERTLACALDEVVGRMLSWNNEMAHEQGVRFGMALMLNFFLK